MKVNLKDNSQLVVPHKWFAWKPVLAEKTTKDGVIYAVVWLETIERKLVRQGGVPVFVYSFSE
jgi:hypothetical protein